MTEPAALPNNDIRAMMGFQVKLVKASVMEKCAVMKNNPEFIFFL